jgi:hypothetical protein
MLSFVFRPTRTTIDSLQLDAAISQSHAMTAQVTDHPLESGEAVVDHVRPAPRTLTVEGVISDTPLRWPSAIVPGRARGAFEALRDLVRTGKPVDVVTGLETYRNMVLRSLTVPRDSGTGGAVRFTAELVEIRFAEVATVPGADARGAKVDAGYQPTDAAPPAVDAKATSAAARVR